MKCCLGEQYPPKYSETLNMGCLEYAKKPELQ